MSIGRYTKREQGQVETVKQKYTMIGTHIGTLKFLNNLGRPLYSQESSAKTGARFSQKNACIATYMGQTVKKIRYRKAW